MSEAEFARPGNHALLVRVYRPAGAGPFPAVVDVHGGAWIGGDRHQNAAIATHLASHGIVVASVEMRKPPIAAYPASVADVNAALRWLKAHATEYDSRPELVGSIGTSSGGHLTLLNAIAPADERFAGVEPHGADGQTAAVTFTIACWPVADPAARYAMAVERGLATIVNAHHAYWPSVALMEEGNPVRMLERGEHGEMPPLLVIMGTADENLPPGLAARLTAAYREAAGDVILEEYAGEPHSFVNKQPESEAAQRALASIVAFVKRHAGA